MTTKQINAKITDTEKSEKDKKVAEAKKVMKAEEKRIADARKLLAAEAREKAEASELAAAKAKSDAEAAELAALTPEQRLGKDWPDKHVVLAPYITQTGKVRGGLNIPDQEKARKILKGYGFKVWENLEFRI